ncbi:S41 family peptidase [Halosquirtibacter laminarini]|uniref:S41 family peptidase n=1 Tax=Halosquirtibacter laminarini TaxID=3374600 RepID=A0AC61NE14_9BACT|nr:S41 family peptidase [Prolixibacteraceae bacterium]
MKKINILLIFLGLFAVAEFFNIYYKTKYQNATLTIPSSSNESPLLKPNKVGLIMNMIQLRYVDTVNNKTLEDEVIPQILKELDPHCAYFPKDDFKNVNEEMKGNFGGVGVQFRIENDTVMIVDVVSGGPSQKLGVLGGDRIVSVNDSTIAGNGVTNEVVMKLLKGKIGTKVKVGIKRMGVPKPINFDITRGEIPLYSVDVSYMLNDTTGYIKVGRFAITTFQEFMKGLDELKEDGAKKFIVDLRGNPGGILGIVAEMANEFLHKGDMIVYTKGRSQPNQEFTAKRDGKYVDQKLVVLIDEYSASASEIFAGAMQDNDRAIIIGRRSFGKGLVQEQVPFSDGSALRLTVARYYTPSGRCIQKPYDKGVDEYNKDIYNRIQHGELEVKDSIAVTDTIKYYTKAGRIVHGGGGIMPDIFVPADTTGFSDLYVDVLSKGLLFKFSFDFADTHREELKKIEEATELKNYLVDHHEFKLFLDYCRKEGVKVKSKDLKVSGNILKVQLWAYTSRNILGEKGFYPIIRELDETLDQAIEVISTK